MAAALGFAVLTPLSAQSLETLGVMGMVNRAMSDANRALAPTTSAAERARIQAHYNGLAAQWQGYVVTEQMRLKLAQRYHYEQRRRSDEARRLSEAQIWAQEQAAIKDALQALSGPRRY
jgi:hypothetical protein